MTAEPKHVLEAALLMAGRSLSVEEMSELLPDVDDVLDVLRELDDDYADRGVAIVRTASGWTLRTREESSDLATALVDPPRRLSPAALQTMVVILCYQPVTRSEIERVRGVQISPGVMQQLLEAKYVRPGPRRETPGRPLTWMSTDAFLEAYDLMSASDLPSHRRLAENGVFDLPRLQAAMSDPSTVLEEETPSV